MEPKKTKAPTPGKGSRPKARRGRTSKAERSTTIGVDRDLLVAFLGRALLAFMPTGADERDEVERRSHEALARYAFSVARERLTPKKR